MNLVSLCEDAHVLRVLLMLKYAMQIIFILVPLILMGTVIAKFAKAAMSGKAEDFKEAGAGSFKKLIAAFAVFFVPTIIEYAIGLAGDAMYDVNFCLERATMDEVKYYEALEPVQVAVANLEQNPTKANLEKARTLVNNAIKDRTIKGANVEDYLRIISNAEQQVNKLEIEKECKLKNGVLKNGHCEVQQIVGVSDGEHGTGEDGPPMGGGDYNGTTGAYAGMEGEYVVVQTKASVEDYARFVASNGISQDANTEEWGDACLSFSYAHAYALFSGYMDGNGYNAAGYKYASYFTSYDNDDKSDVLQKIYNEVSNGRPCVIQVNGNKQGTSRHYVTVVGYRKNIKSGRQLTEEDLLIMDSWDGKIERMDTEKSRFMVTGAACHKSYSGYQMYYLKG